MDHHDHHCHCSIPRHFVFAHPTLASPAVSGTLCPPCTGTEGTPPVPRAIRDADRNHRMMLSASGRTRLRRRSRAMTVTFDFHGGQRPLLRPAPAPSPHPPPRPSRTPRSTGTRSCFLRRPRWRGPNAPCQAAPVVCPSVDLHLFPLPPPLTRVERGAKVHALKAKRPYLGRSSTLRKTQDAPMAQRRTTYREH